MELEREMNKILKYWEAPRPIRNVYLKMVAKLAKNNFQLKEITPEDIRLIGRGEEYHRGCGWQSWIVPFSIQDRRESFSILRLSVLIDRTWIFFEEDGSWTFTIDYQKIKHLLPPSKRI